ncbi:putative ribonuclease H-like domain-containing protein [Tanacetum coccineum]
MKKDFQACCMNWGEVNPTHAYYNGSCTIKDTEDPSWSTSIKTRRQRRHLQHRSAWMSFYHVVFVLDRNIAFHDVASFMTWSYEDACGWNGYDLSDQVEEDPTNFDVEEPRVYQEKDDNVSNINNVNAAGIEVNAVDPKSSIKLLNDLNMPELEDIVYSDDAEDVSVKADMNNLDTFMPFMLQHVWTLMDLPNGNRAIGTKWVYRNKKDERGIVIKNKMDVKNAFIYGKIEEEVHVCQPPGFEDLDFPNRVYKVEKVLYRLHQAPRAWYETLLTYLLDNRFQRGKIDKTLFIRKNKGDILLLQVYVDDIFFSSTKKSLCTKFEKMMHKKFQMSSMGELIFFLGLQVKHKEDKIFISQDKYVTEILKKFGFSDVKTANTPMETHKPLLKDADGEDVDEHLYRSMIGSLMYLTSSRPDIMFAVCACARFQVNPKSSRLHAMKRIFRYLNDQPKLGLWYPKESPFELVAYTDSDYAGASLDRKSTTGVKNPIFHLKTKHIEIRHHFIRDSNEKKLIQMIKIHIEQNVVDLLTKAFDCCWYKVTTAYSELVLLVQSYNCLFRVNAAGTKLQLLKGYNYSRIKTAEKIKIDWRSRILT